MNLHLNTRKLRHESLEERALLAVTAGGFELAAALPEPAGATAWIVNTTDDAMDWDETDDVLSLREAISRAQTGDTITFDDSLAGGTITLCGSQLEINTGITIDATSVGGITIDANGQSRVLYVSGGSAENPVGLISLTITGGDANGDNGGGIYNGYNSTLTLTDSAVSGNTAYHGGGIRNSGMLTLANSTVSGNAAYDGGGDGGGIFNEKSLVLTDAIVSGNTASSCGGIYNDFSGILTITNSNIIGNAVNYNGGGIYNNGMVTLTNCTVSGNTANFSGGIGNNNTLTLTNTILSLNYANDSVDLYSYRSYSGSNNLIGVDPGFVVAPIFENGVLINSDELDLSLTSKSPSIDRGTNDAVETKTDIAGNPRIFAAWRESPTVDIGAYEYQEHVNRSTIEQPTSI